MGRPVHASCSLWWPNSKAFMFSLFLTTHQAGCQKLVFVLQKVALKLQFVLICISASTLITRPALPAALGSKFKGLAAEWGEVWV